MFAIGDRDHDGNQDSRVNHAEVVSTHFPITAVGLNSYGKKFNTEGDVDGDIEINLREFIHPMDLLAAKALSR